MKLLSLIIFLFLSLLPHDTKKFDDILYQKSKGLVVEHKSYVVAYDTTRRTTLWVSYTLTRDMVTNVVVKRSNNFRKDPLVPNSPSPSDYYGSGYDQGHLANAQDMRFDKVSQSESFYMTNMLPQNPRLNRGTWRKLEVLSRRWAYDRGNIIIITGALFISNKVQYIGDNRIPVPTHCYKIIYDPKRKEAIAFIFKNDYATEELPYYVVTINNIEKYANVDFLHTLDDEIEEKIESKKDYTWFKQ